MLKSLLLLFFGSFCASTAVIFIKLSHSGPMLLAGSRCLLAAALLSPLFFYYRKQFRPSEFGPWHRRVLIPGLLLSVHFSTWILGARMTPASNSSLIVNFVPIVMPFFMLAFGKERINRPEMIGTIIALAGVLFLFYEDIHISEISFWGDVICFGSMLSFCVYLFYAQLNGQIPIIWLYVVPLYFTTGVCSLAASFILGESTSGLDKTEWLYIVLLALIPTIMGHSILNYSMKRLRSQIVAIGNLSQCLFASILAVYFLNEIPKKGFYVAASCLVLSLGVALKGKKQA